MSDLGDRQFWESMADDWLEKFCAPGKDPFGPAFNLKELVDIVPQPGARTLDIGCGDGRVAAMLTDAGHHVIGLDGAPTLAKAATASGLSTTVGDGASLPFPDAIADAVVSSMVLMDIDDLDAHLGELARVTRGGGSLCMAILHPLMVSGFPLGDEHLTFAVGNYLKPERHNWVNGRNGVPMRFWQRPVSAYVNAIGEAGFSVVQMEEPAMPAEIAAADNGEIWGRVPMFLHLRAVRNARS